MTVIRKTDPRLLAPSIESVIEIAQCPQHCSTSNFVYAHPIALIDNKSPKFIKVGEEIFKIRADSEIPRAAVALNEVQRSSAGVAYRLGARTYAVFILTSMIRVPAIRHLVFRVVKKNPASSWFVPKYDALGVHLINVHAQIVAHLHDCYLNDIFRRGQRILTSIGVVEIQFDNDDNDDDKAQHAMLVSSTKVELIQE